MTQHISRDQLEKAIKSMVAQSELFPESLTETAADLNDEDLEKLTITLHVALQKESKLTDEDQERLATTLSKYEQGKQRIYQAAQAKLIAQHEAVHEAQESLFEENLLAQL